MNLSSIDILWNAIPDDAKLKMPHGIYEEVWAMHRQEIIDAVDGFPLPNRHMLGDEYYEATFNTEEK